MEGGVEGKRVGGDLREIFGHHKRDAMPGLLFK